MEKMKINMVSGANLEKPLVTAFKGNGSTFVVFDNEMNAPMGYPIILVSKLENNKLTLIGDAEWGSVKEILRLIISGNQVDYVSVAKELNADDMFFKQLTLPVESFEALKNNYKPADATVVEEPVTVSTPAVEEQPVNFENPMSSVGPMPNVAPVEQPSVNTPTEPENNDAVNMDIPEVQQAFQTEPVIPTAPIQNQEVAQVVDTPVEAPVVEPIPDVVESEATIDFTADKEAFLKACENMFDALVAKFKN